MNNLKMKFWGESKYWWLILLIGIILIFSGFAYWLFPAIGFAIASQIFGWLLVLTGIIQLCVSAGANRPRGWGWWLAGGVVDLFIGFLLVRNILLSEFVFPYFIAFVLFLWGFSAIFSSIANRERRGWWLYLINGILMLFLSYFFLEAGYVGNMMTISFLTALAFIYWGFTLCTVGYDLRPRNNI